MPTVITVRLPRAASGEEIVKALKEAAMFTESPNKRWFAETRALQFRYEPRGDSLHRIPAVQKVVSSPRYRRVGPLSWLNSVHNREFNGEVWRENLGDSSWMALRPVSTTALYKEVEIEYFWYDTIRQVEEVISRFVKLLA